MRWWWAAALGMSGLVACGGEPAGPGPVDDTAARSGGDLTVFDQSSSAFSLPAPNLDAEALDRHNKGDAAFEATFVSSPAPVNPGLGPFFNETSCRACHQGDGRGRAPEVGEPLGPLLLRVSVPGAAPGEAPLPVPRWGGQLQPRATAGFTPEVAVTLSYIVAHGTLAGGVSIELRSPQFQIRSDFGALPAGMLTSPRMAPPVFGLGLLEAVSDQTILALADPEDRDGDGISGRPNYAVDVATGRRMLSRFGWKANAPTLLHQTAAAYHEDIGVTSTYFPIETCRDLIDHPRCQDHEPDVSAETVDRATFYVRTLAVPARRRLGEAQTQAGERLFRAVGCNRCHLETLRTGTLPGVPAVSNQSIHPYTDLLLHDMGDELADGRPDGEATGREWRTPPLWGIGLTQVVNGHSNFLHDGRARSLLEAILWHGGEAAGAADRFRNLSETDRAALLAFLESL